MLAVLTLHEWLQKFRDPLVLFGLGGQIIFMLRFLVQWIASERRGRSYIPIGFWYISLFGGMLLLIYAFLNGDPVIMIGQLLGLSIYSRNLCMIFRRRARHRRRAMPGPVMGVADNKPANPERSFDSSEE
ncbi:MAG: lipid-A-disaccharide synthase N-terminal domain-containing protein [Planctomycetes bacterium]|nr:lipid-A-disaccharide synthase N-terminal domain-containing protein [Planctomycetota bacterium]